jgi:glyoxylase-like metal-dependent hydrolase (beta-lactamase superfamily II)
VTLIDTGAAGSGAEIVSALPGVDRIVLTHDHVDHSGSAAELHDATGAPVLAGAGDAAAIRMGAALPPPVFEAWEMPIYQWVSAQNLQPSGPVDAHRG